MPHKIPKKGDHEPNKYFEGEAILTEAEKLTEQKIITPEKFEEYDIEALCSKFLVNKIYYKMAKKKHREKALIISANIIVKKGLELQNKLNQNDSAISKTDKLGQEQTIGNDADKAGKSDIPKISGGTLSEVITKITEMLSGKSGSDLKNGANNFSAMIEVLSAPEVSKKFSQTMICLAQDPVLVVVIKDLLKDTKASNIFASAIDQNFSASEKAAVSAVLPSDVELRKQENIISNIADKKLVNYQHQI